MKKYISPVLQIFELDKEAIFTDSSIIATQDAIKNGTLIINGIPYNPEIHFVNIEF